MGDLANGQTVLGLRWPQLCPAHFCHKGPRECGQNFPFILEKLKIQIFLKEGIKSIKSIILD